MRLTFKCATAGEEGSTQFPVLKHESAWYCDSNGILDESRVRADLKDTDGIQFASNDNVCSIACAVEFLDRVKLTYQKFASEHEGDLRQVDISKKERKTTCDRRLLNGKVVYIRVDISISHGSVRIALSYNNPKNVVGETENFAGIIATTFADIIIALRDDIQKENHTPFILVEGDNCAGIFARRERMAEKRAAYKKYKNCTHYREGYCSPLDISCPLCKNGKCTVEDILKDE